MKVELICFLYNKKMVDDLGIDCPDILASITIDTDCIESVRERGTDDGSVLCDKTCMVYFKSGETFQVGKSYKDMVGIWNGSIVPSHSESPKGVSVESFPSRTVY